MASIKSVLNNIECHRNSVIGFYKGPQLEKNEETNIKGWELVESIDYSIGVNKRKFLLFKKCSM